MTGGNSTGYLYGAFNGLGEGLHLSYNYINCNLSGTPSCNFIPNTGGNTTQLSVTYDAIRLGVGAINTPPSTVMMVTAGGVGINVVPTQALDVNGNANVRSNLTAPATGTSSLAVSSITLATGNTSITGQYNYTQSLGTLTSGGLIAINAPNRSGLYAMVIRTTATDSSSMQACLSAMGYYNTVSGWTYGGNGYSVLNGVANGSQFAQFFVTTGALYYKVQGATATNMSCAVIQIGGVISGF
jgi:hypothetical protein